MDPRQHRRFARKPINKNSPLESRAPASNEESSSEEPASDIPTPSGTGSRILLGIDYGTTYTGLAWIQTDGQNSPSLSDITVYRSWPEKDAQKVPSSFSYSRTSAAKRCRQWGYSIDDESEVLRWTKLELEPRTAEQELGVVRELMKGLDLISKLRVNEDAAATSDIPHHISKSSEDVVRDYMTKIAREWYQHMRSVGRYTLENVPLDIVITHPATWSYEASNKTFRAINGALSKNMFPTLRDIFSTSEPEACALYTVQDMLQKDHNSLIPGECFVLCDAGGGTVDLVSYFIDSIEPLKLKKVGALTGDKYGATLIDRAFLEWLEPRLENLDLQSKDFGNGGHVILMPKGRVLLERFEKYKHAFTGTEEANITLPRGTVVAADYEDGLGSGVIKLTTTDLQKMFEKSVKGTLKLISQQIVHVEHVEFNGIPCHVTNVFLAGGFAENQYLFNEVKRFADTKADTHVQRADDCWSGVVKGALLRGMGIGIEPPAKLRSCPRHYGVCVNQRYQDWRHTGENAVRDVLDGTMKVHDQLHWLIRQGDLILPEVPLTSTEDVHFQVTQQQYESGISVRLTFVATAAKDAPSSVSGLPPGRDEIRHLDIDIRQIPKEFSSKHKSQDVRGSYFLFDLKVEIRVYDRVDVIVRLSRDGRRLADYDTRLKGLLIDRPGNPTRDIQSSNTSEQAWTLPFSTCSSNTSLAIYDSYYPEYGTSARAVENGSTVILTIQEIDYINGSTDICSEPQPCADSGCYILIEGIGRNTTGPANSNIVALSYGITSLLLIITTATIAIIMGSCISQVNSKGGRDPNPILNSRLYNPPPSRELPKSQQYFPPARTSKHKAKEIAQCSDLLRKMYAVDLIVWSMEGCLPSEVPKREELKRKANALFAEITRIIHGWKSTSSVRWSAEERQHIEEISRSIAHHNVRRYEDCT
ncbi:hypothetical protein G7Y89_g13022 [Cudoniella acicularis]|uniref:Uncharacterized protein n=1 Tax=Cudoniella acicularis TaxID=354080 RepID=A0A8H4RBH8_9HELO|nr:hypothetical protein G7Y89_g13022 [Cudoniella acicularis]